MRDAARAEAAAVSIRCRLQAAAADVVREAEEKAQRVLAEADSHAERLAAKRAQRREQELRTQMAAEQLLAARPDRGREEVGARPRDEQLPTQVRSGTDLGAGTHWPNLHGDGSGRGWWQVEPSSGKLVSIRPAPLLLWAIPVAMAMDFKMAEPQAIRAS